MTKFLKISFLLFLIFNLSNCGFEVIYREKDSGISYTEELAAIKIQKDSQRLSQDLRNSLYDIFNPDSIKVEPKYYITLTIRESTGATFLTETGAVGRNKVTLSVNYSFYNLKTLELITTGTASASDNYDVDRNRYGTYVTKDYTISNLTKILAQNIRNLLVNDIIEMKKEKKEGSKKQEKIK